MQITKELLQQDKLNLEAQLEQLKAGVAQTQGALQTINGMIAFLEREEAPSEDKPAEQAQPSTEISEINRAVQEAEAARQAARNAEAIPLSEIAKAIAGEGAVVEAIEPLGDETVHYVEKASDYVPAAAARKVNAYGKYEKVNNG